MSEGHSRDREILAQYREGMSQPALARRHGLSRQRVHQILGRLTTAEERAAIRSRRYWVETRCGTCGQSVRRRREDLRRRRRIYCDFGCYMEAIRRPEYQQHRQSQREARRKVELALGQMLEPGWVVHHKDGDSTNNALENLVLFGSQADHMCWHRGGGMESGVEPIWGG